MDHEIVQMESTFEHSRDELQANLCQLECEYIIETQKFLVQETFTRIIEKLTNLNFQINSGHISRDSKIYDVALRQCLALNVKDTINPKLCQSYILENNPFEISKMLYNTTNYNVEVTIKFFCPLFKTLPIDNVRQYFFYYVYSEDNKVSRNNVPRFSRIDSDPLIVLESFHSTQNLSFPLQNAKLYKDIEVILVNDNYGTMAPQPILDCLNRNISDCTFRHINYEGS